MMIQAASYRIHWSIKLSVFAASVLTLSWFFAGYRQVQEVSNLLNWALLAAGVLFTLLLVLVQAFWIYFEEMDKGTLKKRIKLFDAIHAKLLAKEAGNNAYAANYDKTLKGEPKEDE